MSNHTVLLVLYFNKKSFDRSYCIYYGGKEEADDEYEILKKSGEKEVCRIPVKESQIRKLLQ